MQLPVPHARPETTFSGDEIYGPGTRAITFACKREAVHASAAGTVVFNGPTPSGNAISISHIGNFRTSYTGVKSTLKLGEHVQAGQPIGKCERDTFKWSAKIGPKSYVDPFRLVFSAPRLSHWN